MEHIPNGIRLTNVSFYGSHYSSDFPAINGVPNNLAHDTSIGGGFTLSWTRSRPRNSLSLSYSPSYTRDLTQGISYSTFNPLNQVLAITLAQKISPSWGLSTGISASVLNTSQYLFESTQYSRVTSLATNPDDLAAAVLKGSNYDNPQLSSVLSGAPLLESPARREFYGDRILNASVQTTATYTHSRLRLSFSGGISRAQPLSTNTPEDATNPRYRVPSSTSGYTSVNIDYSLSPRTQIGASMAASETISRFDNSYAPTISLHLSRRMGMRWVVDLHGGTGFFVSLREQFRPPSGPQYLSGGSLGVKVGAHTFLLSADRSIATQYGLGSTTNLSSMSSWNWDRPGRSWSVTARGGYQQLRSSSFSDIKGWQGMVGLSQTLSRPFAVAVTYAYMQNSLNLVGVAGNWSLQGARVALMWTPSRMN